MASDLGESTSSESPNSSIPVNNTNRNDAGSFECNICFELALDPIFTLCGHLYCWTYLYQWLHGNAQSSECPVCKAFIEENKLVPLYGRGKVPWIHDLNSTQMSTFPIVQLTKGLKQLRGKIQSKCQHSHRPVGQRPETAQRPALPPPHSLNQFAQMKPWFMGGKTIGGARSGNYTFSAVIGGLFPLLNFQMHGFLDATSYGTVAGFPYGYPHAFHGGHAWLRQVAFGQQADVYLNVLLIMVSALVIASLVWL